MEHQLHCLTDNCDHTFTVTWNDVLDQKKCPCCTISYIIKYDEFFVEEAGEEFDLFWLEIVK